MSVLAQAVYGNWSLYNEDGTQAVPFDTFFSVEVSNEAKVTQYPTEPNQFASYNKVQSPGAVSVTVGLTGGAIDRASVLLALEELVQSTDLLSIVTPEKTYTDYNLESYDYTRVAEEGVDRLKVNLRLVEVQQVESEYSNETIPAPKQAADSTTTSAGKQVTDTTSSSASAAAEQKSQTRSQSALSAIIS